MDRYSYGRRLPRLASGFAESANPPRDLPAPAGVRTSIMSPCGFLQSPVFLVNSRFAFPLRPSPPPGASPFTYAGHPSPGSYGAIVPSSYDHG